MKLRDYQIKLSELACEKLHRLKIAYLCMEVRTGKTLTALNAAQLFGSKSVLFLTKKKAIEDAKKDFESFGFTFDLEVCNDESLHKIDGDFDLLIHDEHHRFGSFPKPSQRTKLLKMKFGHLPMIFLSGTPFPESYSQVYHQFFVSDYSPFKEHKNFYKWSKEFVNVTQKQLGYATVNDYSNADYSKIEPFIDKYMIKYTQEKAGFTSKINETVLYCEMQESTYKLCNRIKKDRVIESKEDAVLADTGVKLMQKLHQMYSGTVKTEGGKSVVFDDSKAWFIDYEFRGKKIAIFYKFKAELKMLKNFFGNKLTTELAEFNTTKKWIALQIVSGREGVSLKKADCLVFMNIDFSAVSYWQARDRLTTKERTENDVYWIFSRGGIEEKIYKTVIQKKDFNLRVFNEVQSAECRVKKK